MVNVCYEHSFIGILADFAWIDLKAYFSTVFIQRDQIPSWKAAGLTHLAHMFSAYEIYFSFPNKIGTVYQADQWDVCLPPFEYDTCKEKDTHVHRPQAAKRQEQS